jgi:hypothetical protein
MNDFYRTSSPDINKTTVTFVCETCKSFDKIERKLYCRRIRYLVDLVNYMRATPSMIGKIQSWEQ